MSCYVAHGEPFHVVEALACAIRHTHDWERKRGYTTDSAILATWKDMLKELDEDRWRVEQQGWAPKR